MMIMMMMIIILIIRVCNLLSYIVSLDWDTKVTAVEVSKPCCLRTYFWNRAPFAFTDRLKDSSVCQNFSLCTELTHFLEDPGILFAGTARRRPPACGRLPNGCRPFLLYYDGTATRRESASYWPVTLRSAGVQKHIQPRRNRQRLVCVTESLVIIMYHALKMVQNKFSSTAHVTVSLLVCLLVGALSPVNHRGLHQG